MRKRIFVIGISVTFLILCSSCFIWSKELLAPDEPVMSVRGGMYDEEVLLELSTSWGHEIYYTTDGSTPTYQSLKYENPIRIIDRSQEENIYRNIKNVVDNWQEYEPDCTPVEKGTVIRAISVSKWGNSSDIVTETYFVGRDDLDQKDVYIISLVADPEELFGNDGIYITGKQYDEWYLAGGTQMTAVTMPNYLKKLEIVGNLEIFEEKRKILNQSVGVRIRGGGSRGGALKYFNLFSREEYSESKTFDTMLFDGIKVHSVMLKPLSIYVMTSDILWDRKVSTQKSQKIKVFLNGEYWYDTYMLERYDQNYFKEHYDVDDTVIINNRRDIECKRDETQIAFEELTEWIENADFTDREEWLLLKERIDIQSYIDYMVANIYLCNGDFWVDHNYMRWFSESRGNAPYEDGRMRWVIYDLDAVGKADENTFLNDMYGNMVVNENPFYKAFYVNEEYRKQFVLSFMDMANNNFSPENMEPILNEYGLDLSWNDNFFLERFGYMTDYLAEEFRLTGTLEPVEISVNDVEGGSISINTSVINLSHGSWSGKYFTDYPITITAKSNEGYVFAGWEGDIFGQDESITVSVEKGLRLKAIFCRKWENK